MYYYHLSNIVALNRAFHDIKFCLTPVAALVAVFPAIAARAAATEPFALVARAVEKLGGAKRLSEIATLSISARHKHWDPQETLERLKVRFLAFGEEWTSNGGQRLQNRSKVTPNKH